MSKSIDEINERILDGSVNVVTAAEMQNIVDEIVLMVCYVKLMLLQRVRLVLCVHRWLF